jgi:hypothetical protein
VEEEENKSAELEMVVEPAPVYIYYRHRNRCLFLCGHGGRRGISSIFLHKRLSLLRPSRKRHTSITTTCSLLL